MIDLQGQAALVTGGSRGIGAATALMLARAGADVAVTFSRHPKQANQVTRKIEKIGRRAIAFHCEVEKERDCLKTADKSEKFLGRIDILVNAAGIWEFGRIGEMSLRKWARSITINLNGTFAMCNAAVPVMLRQNYGRIINVSSTAGQRGEALHSQYAASKGGIIAFTKSIAVELIPRNIWVNCVAPGWVATDLVSSVFKKPSIKKQIFQSIPRGFAASPEDIAGPILFLASSLANHVVGEILNVNGGSVLCG